jgi:tripartite-type tricarboxylate transporter receptor subunit TctC
MSQMSTQAGAVPGVQKALPATGFTPLSESPKAFEHRIARDRSTWGPVAKSLDLALE